ncbi:MULTISPECIES: hypothetical protein [unclassified Nocardiopsis]|uniref:hypothetical protein n=1 Tax=unclassified Nocardiopsis TaxID=2649073 RepID=UPI0013574414|nr:MULTISPECIES: hypothetical protein [unclassified Nocardiopsis]
MKFQLVEPGDGDASPTAEGVPEQPSSPAPNPVAAPKHSGDADARLPVRRRLDRAASGARSSLAELRAAASARVAATAHTPVEPKAAAVFHPHRFSPEAGGEPR